MTAVQTIVPEEAPAESMPVSVRRSPLARRRARAGRLFIAPNMLAVLVFLLFPLGFSLWLSFQRWDLFHAPRFIGLANYRRLFTEDPLTGIALRNTVVFTLGTVVPTTMISLVVAALLGKKLRGIGIFRSIVFLPLIASAVAMTVVWRFVFNTESGLFNAVLGWFGLGPISWLTDPFWAMVSLCIVSVWKSVPFATVILLAAMQGVPAELYEAARLDGAGAMRRLWSVTLPMIRPALAFVFVISIINSFQVFDMAYLLTGGSGGPETGTYVFSIMLFENAFSFDDLGYACALAWVLFAFLVLLTALQLRMTRDKNPEV